MVKMRYVTLEWPLRVGVGVRIRVNLTLTKTLTIYINPNLLSYWECCRNNMVREKKLRPAAGRVICFRCTHN